MNPALATPKIATDPGFLYYAPLGTAEPVHTVTASVFSDSWTAATGWVPVGATEEGHTFSWTTSTDTIEVAELLDPLKYIETGRSGSFAFACANIDALTMKMAMNGGTLNTTGSTTTKMTTYTPPALGQSVRIMIGWESTDCTERLIGFQCFNTAAVSISRRKGNAKATVPVEFALEVPSGGQPFKYIAAGARA